MLAEKKRKYSASRFNLVHSDQFFPSHPIYNHLKISFTIILKVKGQDENLCRTEDIISLFFKADLL